MRNPDPPSKCHRNKCIPCLHGAQHEDCYRPGVAYRIICNRSPCSDGLGTSLKDLQTEKLRSQLEKLNPGDPKPAIYEGESFKGAFNRTQSHWSKYNTPSGQGTSFMWHHTVSHHSSIIGESRGIQDYKFIILEFFKTNLSRLCDEGRRQGIMEAYQSKGIINCLNSKLDFVQPLRTQLTVINKATNSAPGQQDRNNKDKNALRNNVDEMSKVKKNKKQPRRIAKGKRRLVESGTSGTSFKPMNKSTPKKNHEQKDEQNIEISPKKWVIKNICNDTIDTVNQEPVLLDLNINDTIDTVNQEPVLLNLTLNDTFDTVNQEPILLNLNIKFTQISETLTTTDLEA